MSLTWIRGLEEENARLRASNKALLKALEEVECLDDPGGACGEVARAAIAAAKGGE
jgi:hypothetical protein